MARFGNMAKSISPGKEGTTSGAMCLTGLPQVYPCSHSTVAMLGYHAMVFLSLGLSLDTTRMVRGRCADCFIKK